MYLILFKFFLRKITCGIIQQDFNQILTGGEDGYLKIYDILGQKTKRMHSISSISLTTMTLLNQPNLVAVILNNKKKSPKI